MNYRKKEHRLLFSTCLLLAGGPPVLMRAAQPEPALDPLVITAERPSGSVLSRSDLDLFQVQSVADLSGLVPDLYVVTSDTRGYGDILSMRGSANTLFFSPPAVGMVVDDVPMGDVSSYPAGLLDYGQVKVLPGPQGTIYGRNGAAGMLDMTTPPPGTKNETHLTTDVGSYDSWGARLRTGGPLGGGFAQTLQLYHQERDGVIYNPTLDRATDDRSVSGGLANLYWKPAPDTEWRLRVLAERADDGSQRLSLLNSRDPFKVTSDIPGSTDMERYQISLHGSKEGPWGRFKSITAWQDWKLDPSVTDLNLTAVPGWSSTIYQSQRMWTQEFRWESPADAGPWSWRTGLFFMDQTSSGDATRKYTVEVFPNYVMPFSERTVYDLDQWNVAGYGRLGYAVNPRLNVQAGVRLEYVDSAIDRTKTYNYQGPSAVSDDQGAWYGSPELGVSYALCDSTRLFARSAVGVKPGGYSAFASTAASARYQDEVAWTNELGAEVSLPDQHLTFTLTGYCNRIDDYQLNRPAIPPSTDYYTVNAGFVTSLGVESQLRWQPVAGLTVQGSVGYVNAEFDSSPYAGNSVPFVPEFTGSLGIRYDFPLGFYAQSSVRVSGATYFDAANTADFRQGSYLVWDGEIGYAMEHFSVALFGRNMLDREYYTYMNPDPNLAIGSPGDPQMFGVRATLDF